MRRDRLPEGPDDRLVVAGLGVAALGPLVVASLLVIVRDHIAGSNAALVFVIVVVLAAALGGRWAGFTAAVISAMSYDFFLTRPYGSLKIDELEDIVATVLLLAVGLIVGEVVVSLEERIVAIAISDQLGAAVAAELDAPKANGARENDPFLS